MLFNLPWWLSWPSPRVYLVNMVIMLRIPEIILVTVTVFSLINKWVRYGMLVIMIILLSFTVGMQFSSNDFTFWVTNFRHSMLTNSGVILTYPTFRVTNHIRALSSIQFFGRNWTTTWHQRYFLTKLKPQYNINIIFSLNVTQKINHMFQCCYIFIRTCTNTEEFQP